MNGAYEAFMNLYLCLYEKYCLKVWWKQKDRNKNKPWITKGLKNACKKKNKLYRDFIKLKTQAAEIKYKVYKNKLVTIIRQAKKDYYTYCCISQKKTRKLGNVFGVCARRTFLIRLNRCCLCIWYLMFNTSILSTVPCSNFNRINGSRSKQSYTSKRQLASFWNSIQLWCASVTIIVLV